MHHLNFPAFRPFLLLCLLGLGSGVTAWAEAGPGTPHAANAERIIKRLRFNDDEKTARVIAATTAYLDRLESILVERDATLEQLEAAAGPNGKPDDRQVAAAYQKGKSRLLPLRDAYVRQLEADLTPRLVERVKDGLTDDALHKLQAMYHEMIPGLKPEEKAHLFGLLVEARENAITALGHRGQNQWFAKYRGIINNYIAAQGHDFTTLSKAWDRAHGEKK